MKKLTLFLFLAACGDNISPAAPDAALDYSDVTPPEPDRIGPDDSPVADAGADASTPDAPDIAVDAAPVAPDAACEDSHIDLNGHEHKCQHDQDLPSTP
jgi:hypothetical protein